jgi:hypothetical protein
MDIRGSMVNGKRREFGLKANPSTTPLPQPVEPRKYPTSAEQQWLDSRRRNIMHLVDLKRAGHSPTQTEFSIPHHGLPVRFDVERAEILLAVYR